MPTSRAELPNETLRFMQRMWHVVHALDVRSKRMARTLGVTGPQRLVIRMLGRSPDSTAGDLVGMLGVHPSTLTGILKRLEDQGALERKTDSDDRRRMRFRLTAKGLDFDRDRKGTVEAAVRRALLRADQATIDKTLQMLDLLVAELDRED